MPTASDPEENDMSNKYMKKCSTSSAIKDENDTELPSHPSQNGYHQENKQQMLSRMRE
jgi:hypothetical protein